MARAVLNLAILATAVTGLAPIEAAAQTEAQARRYVVPYVRTATNCIAQEAIRDPGIVTARNSNSWSSVIETAAGRCAREVAAMVAAHDRMHGMGTGMIFFRGAYIDDLPRAIVARVGNEISQKAQSEQLGAAQRQAQIATANADREAAANRARTERAERITSLEGARDLLRERMYDCMKASVKDLVPSGEPASVLASAAVTMCADSFDSFVTATRELETARINAPFTPAEADHLRNVLKKVVTEYTQVIAVQAKAARSATEYKAPEDSAAAYFQRPASK